AQRLRERRGPLRGRIVDFVRVVRDAVVEAHRLLRERAQPALLRRDREVRRRVRMHRGDDVGARLERRGVQVVRGRARLAAGLPWGPDSIPGLPSASYLTRFEAVTCSMKTLSALTRKSRGSPGTRAEMWL